MEEIKGMDHSDNKAALMQSFRAAEHTKTEMQSHFDRHGMEETKDAYPSDNKATSMQSKKFNNDSSINHGTGADRSIPKKPLGALGNE